MNNEIKELKEYYHVTKSHGKRVSDFKEFLLTSRNPAEAIELHSAMVGLCLSYNISLRKAIELVYEFMQGERVLILNMTPIVSKDCILYLKHKIPLFFKNDVGCYDEEKNVFINGPIEYPFFGLTQKYYSNKSISDSTLLMEAIPMFIETCEYFNIGYKELLDLVYKPEPTNDEDDKLRIINDVIKFEYDVKGMAAQVTDFTNLEKTLPTEYFKTITIRNAIEEVHHWAKYGTVLLVPYSGRYSHYLNEVLFHKINAYSKSKQLNISKCNDGLHAYFTTPVIENNNNKPEYLELLYSIELTLAYLDYNNLPRNQDGEFESILEKILKPKGDYDVDDASKALEFIANDSTTIYESEKHFPHGNFDITADEFAKVHKLVNEENTHDFTLGIDLVNYGHRAQMVGEHMVNEYTVSVTANGVSYGQNPFPFKDLSKLKLPYFVELKFTPSSTINAIEVSVGNMGIGIIETYDSSLPNKISFEQLNSFSKMLNDIKKIVTDYLIKEKIAKPIIHSF